MNKHNNKEFSDKKIVARMLITSKEKARQFLSKWTMEHGSSWEEGIKYLRHLGIGNNFLPDNSQRTNK